MRWLSRGRRPRGLAGPRPRACCPTRGESRVQADLDDVSQASVPLREDLRAAARFFGVELAQERDDGCVVDLTACQGAVREELRVVVSRHAVVASSGVDDQRRAPLPNLGPLRREPGQVLLRRGPVRCTVPTQGQTCVHGRDSVPDQRQPVRVSRLAPLHGDVGVVEDAVQELLPRRIHVSLQWHGEEPCLVPSVRSQPLA